MARVVGWVGLLGIVAGAFDIGYVQKALLVNGNAAATLEHLRAHEMLFRLGFSSHLLELVLNVVGEVVGFYLLRRVNRIVATLALVAGVIGIGVEAVDLIGAYLPWLLATRDSGASGQTERLWQLATQVQQAGLLLSWVFDGVDEVATGFLLFRSGFVPRVLGALLGLSGLSYFAHGLLSFAAPSLDVHLAPLIPLLCLPGEGLSSLWLAVMAVNAAKWNELAVSKSSAEAPPASSRTLRPSS